VKTGLWIVPWLVGMVFSLQADTTDASIDSDVQRMSIATRNCDATSIIDLTYFPLVSAMGGKEAAILAMARVFGMFKSRGMKITRFETLKPYTKISGDTHDYVIIPTREDMQIGPHDFETQSYLVAVKLHDSANWQYATASKQVESDRDALFPDLPKSVALPPMRTIRID
jgi:hypothetical protein